MWADNETTIDLLGSDYLVDSLLVVLTETRLLPVTVGISGDWGSGKTSLMGMAAEALCEEALAS
jgi:KAP family P-loop domain